MLANHSAWPALPCADMNCCFSGMDSAEASQILCKLEQAQAQAQQKFLDDKDPEMFHWRLAIAERAMHRLAMWHKYHNDPGLVPCPVFAGCSSGDQMYLQGASWEPPHSAQPYCISRLQDSDVHQG